ncbi:HNH endonuclease [Vibrio phage 11895-B1]|uniref:HNH endonuclease n=1 Tax=Vibrio phage 11895-B1 TaxID=754075 RepID=UPI0002C0970F|nr:HNH endonuclease [Vibrio phage 11895-B1]AGH32158.1 hypothetical protein VPHG_00091 [Vibrio phage 11895-B1]
MRLSGKTKGHIIKKLCLTEGCNNYTTKVGVSSKKTGLPLYSSYCTQCKRAVKKGYPIYHIYKRDVCELCGFIPKHSCQLDVDHKDNDKFNIDMDNLQTLCANCHRLKTYNNKDWLTRDD